ncbi:MAG: glycoside hydrolase family 16 protein [Bacteroidetes bacterium]|nr:glycoside hydrolase family 16 protein [Bacteroidota bacterium]
MKRLLFIGLIFISCHSFSQLLWQINADTVIQYYYTDGDEFSESEINLDKWSHWYGWARSIASNKEQQYYTDFMQNHELKNGCLYLNVNKESVNAKLVDWMNDNDTIKSGKKFNGLNKRDYKYTAGMIQSKRQFNKGYFEIKFKAPSDKGLWPAFWLYGGTPNEEIDIMELKGERENQTHVETHCQGCDMVRNPIGQKRSFGGWIKLDGDLDKEFNIVSGLWENDEVRYYMNGRCIAVSKVKFDKPKNLVANVAVADDNGPFHPGPEKEDTSFEPMVIDYIRVWTKDDGQETHLVVNANDKNAPPANTDAKSKPKMLYGKKKDHEKDGIFVSLVYSDQNTFKLYCNGLAKKETYTVKFLLGTEVIFEKTGSDRELDIPYGIKPGLKIEVEYKGKKAEKVYLTR